MTPEQKARQLAEQKARQLGLRKQTGEQKLDDAALASQQVSKQTVEQMLDDAAREREASAGRIKVFGKVSIHSWKPNAKLLERILEPTKDQKDGRE
jgi:hypothetical protein